MIRSLAKAVGFAALLAAASAGAVTPASAQVDLYIDGDRGPPPRYYREGPPPRGWDGPPPRRDWDRPRGCNPRMAEDMARDFGFRRARVVDVTPRRVVVEGFTRRGPDEISFANRPGCPVMRR